MTTLLSQTNEPRVVKKVRYPEEKLNLQIALSRLRGVGDLIFKGNEPMLSMRLEALLGEVEAALINSTESK